MHLYTFHELNKLHVNRILPLKRISPEQSVLISSKKNENFSSQGKFDFLVETEKGRLIGFEVLTRPSQGKMKSKLRYAKQVDEFVFVLPFDALSFYLKPKTKVFHKKCKLKFLSREFNDPKLSAWLLDLGEGKFTEKNSFNKVFCVKNEC